MLILASFAAFLLLIVLAVQVRWGNQFIRLYANLRDTTSDLELPHVGVILSLRGADPFLENSLTGLMCLDYPSHEIHVIIDSPTDPAVAVVERLRTEFNATHVQVEFLNVCQNTSSLKNAALIQGINSCTSQCEVFAWLDADTVPHRNWLKDLVAPFQDDTVGAACGIRWYAPPSSTIANYVRHIWNSGAVLQMVAFGIGWGGTFAIRKSVFQRLQLERKICHALVEDTLTSNELLLDGSRLKVVAECTMSNAESASLTWCLSFVTRQLQALRYYHSAWRRVLLFGLFSGFALVANLGILAYGLLYREFACAAIAGAVLITFGLVVGWLMHRSERCINACLGSRAIGEYSRPWMLILAAPVTQLIHMVALVQACAHRSVTWRGIRYEIRSGLNIKRTNYAPYQPESSKAQHSL